MDDLKEFITSTKLSHNTCRVNFISRLRITIINYRNVTVFSIISHHKKCLKSNLVV